MKTLKHIVAIIMLACAGMLASISAGSAEDPLPGSCGLPNPDETTFAFAGSGQTTDTPVFDFDMKRCQSGTLDVTYVLGCGPDYFANNPGHGALNLSLAQAGFRTPDATSTTLLDVISQTNGGSDDTYLLQAVTGYLNSLYVDGYAYDSQTVLDGYHDGLISEGSFAWYNHGATSQFVVPSCPLSTTKGNSD